MELPFVVRRPPELSHVLQRLAADLLQAAELGTGLPE
jgi:hypothetical protein